MPFIRAYLRASTDDQDAGRARTELEQFARERSLKVAAWYAENESGASRFIYKGRLKHAPAQEEPTDDSYCQLQREAEDAAHRWYCASLGICPGEVPY